MKQQAGRSHTKPNARDPDAIKLQCKAEIETQGKKTLPSEAESKRHSKCGSYN